MARIGVLYQGFPEGRPSADARWVEDLGYDSIWVGDHVLFYLDGLATAMALGAGTQKIMVGNAILLVPLRNPALLARSLATMALEMEGRYVLGAGAGGDVPAEFQAAGMELRRRGARMEWVIEQVRSALDEGQLDHHEFTDRPASGAPPVWFGGRSDRAANRAATIGDGFIPYLVTAEQYVPLLEKVADARAAGPRASREFTAGVDVMVAIGRTHEEAVQDAMAYGAYGLDEALIRKHTVIGTAEEVTEGLSRFVKAGAQHVIAHVAAPPDKKRGRIELLASVIDDVHRLGESKEES